MILKNLIGIISDNRLGVLSNKVPSVYITHQVTVISGLTTFISTKAHQYFINKFDECWIPDFRSNFNLSGKLSKGKLKIKTRYLGILSRFRFQQTKPKYDLLVLLSGLEPLRTSLENKIISELKNYKGTVLFVRGIMSENNKKEVCRNIIYYDFLESNELEEAINRSELVLCRSGYSTILDVAKLNKKVFLIPTNGQDEQVYLAKHLEELGIAPNSTTHNFKIEMLQKVEKYNGFNKDDIKPFPTELFNLFKRK